MLHPDASKRRADNLITWLRRYSEARIDGRSFDERRCVPPFVILDFGNRGLFGVQIPEEFGGLGLRYRDACRVFEQLAAIDLSLASLVFIHNANGVRPIMGFAPEALRKEVLPILASGRELSAFGLTEPDASSRFQGVETRAEPDGNSGWRLTGTKRWNASGWAGIYSVFARVPEASGRLGRVSAFCVRVTDPGVRVGPESLTMGVRSIMQNALVLKDVRVSEERLLGEVGQGMEIADETLLVARIYLSSVCLGGMKRCAQLMLRYGTRRQVSTGSLVDSPITRDALLAVTCRITALQSALNHLLEILDEGDYPPEAAAIAIKVFASEAVFDSADAMMQLLGGRGYMENNIAPQIFRDCRMLRVGEGPNELLALSLGRRVQHETGFRALIEERLGASELAAELSEVAAATSARCMSKEGCFGDRSSAVVWAQSLIGGVAVWTLVVAALRADAGKAPDAEVERALGWAENHLSEAREKALHGDPSEALLVSTETARDMIRSYEKDIGDLEPAAPGIETEIDPMLRRGIDDAAASVARPLERPLSGEEKRRLAQELLKSRTASGVT
jgi:alkylation response protein AidB-like acyl-CoA dehydrogenase